MKIALYATTILEHGGGLEKYLIETAKNLSELPNFQVDVITMDDVHTEKIARILGFYYFKKIDRSLLYKESSDSIAGRLGKARYSKCRDFKELKKKLNEYDVVYSKNELLEAFILKFFLRYKKIPPVVFGCHTPIYYPVADSLQSKMHNVLYNGLVYRWLASGVNAFHVTNTHDEKLFKHLFPRRTVYKIYNAFDLFQFIRNVKQYLYPFSWDGSKYQILWIARLTEQKGVSSLIRIIEKINATDLREKVIFNIVGNGEFENEIDKLRKKWNNVNWFGYVEYRFLPNIYSQNNLYICTSKWEAFGLSVLEAQAIGMPAISFNIPGPQDIIQNGKSGFLVTSEEEFCRKMMEIVHEEIQFNKDAIIENVYRTFNPKDVYLNLSEMFLTVAGKKDVSFSAMSDTNIH
jgi:glycosyltransferase involved in cell wall biosynthesis